MPNETGSFWFKSSLFEVEPGEEDEINPGIYGRQAANWLATKLRAIGYDVEVINEDWGRCLMCLRDPVWLWVGCASMDMDLPEVPKEPPKKEDLVWHCFIECEVPFWMKLFKRTDAKPFTEKLEKDLSSILGSEPQIQLVAEPS